MAAILLIACHARPAAERIGRWLPQRHRPRRATVWWTGALAGILLLAVSISAAQTVLGRSTSRKVLANGLYDFLATLPKTAVIAGTVHEIGGVPLVAQRSVFWHAEFHAPFFKDYYREVQRRRDALRQLEARRFADIDRFCRDFGVTHFVFARSQRPLASAAEHPAIFEDARFVVIQCGSRPGVT